MKKASIVSLLLLVSMLATAFLPSGTAFAADKGAYVPTIVDPVGVILDKTPQYVWTAVSGATYYQFRVYQYTTLKIDKTVTSAVCAGGNCSYTHSFALTYKDYDWKVRAKVNNVWQNWSTIKTFVVSSPSFTSGFNFSLDGWERMNEVGGIWYKSTNYAYTTGKGDFWSNLQRTANDGKYADFDYTTVIKRVGGVISGKYPANCAAVRMGAYTTSGKYLWWPGYRFCVTNAGKYGIFYMDDDASTAAIVNWVANANVHTTGWNTLRVVAVGEDFQFYVNGVLVKSFTNNLKDRGYVGLSMWKNLGTDTSFQVDYAALTVITATADALSASSAEIKAVPVSNFNNSD